MKEYHVSEVREKFGNNELLSRLGAVEGEGEFSKVEIRFRLPKEYYDAEPSEVIGVGRIGKTLAKRAFLRLVELLGPEEEKVSLSGLSGKVSEFGGADACAVASHELWLALNPGNLEILKDGEREYYVLGGTKVYRLDGEEFSGKVLLLMPSELGIGVEKERIRIELEEQGEDKYIFLETGISAGKAGENALLLEVMGGKAQ